MKLCDTVIQVLERFASSRVGQCLHFDRFLRRQVLEGRDEWSQAALRQFAAGYGEVEPEYTLADDVRR